MQVIWDSECEEGIFFAKLRPLSEYAYYIAIDDQNGVMRLSDYERDGMHTTSMMFVGPDALTNAEKFNAFAADVDQAEDEGESELSVNCDTEKLIKKCFNLS